jgi:hypothetical protein
MIRSRPGFQTQIIDDSTEVAYAGNAPLNKDMLPAIARRSTATPAKSNSPLTQTTQPVNTVEQQATISPEHMQAAADAAWARMKAKMPQGKMDPEIIKNPTPSPVVEVNDPYADLQS